jgi:ABC-type transport system substrate-binding protein
LCLRSRAHASLRDERRLATGAAACHDGVVRVFRSLLFATIAAAAGTMLTAGDARAAADPAKVLRIASPDIETLDPQQYDDNPSFEVLMGIFEGLYEFDYLASPVRLAPLTATALPEITDGGLTWTIHVKPGIRFTPDPAFGGKPRELVAADYVFSLKRWLDPNLHRGGDASITPLIVGARALVDAAKQPGAHFDYAAPMAGLRALDRYTLQLKLTAPVYSPIEFFLTLGACAHEVVEAAGRDIGARPVGTGPYMLKSWQRGSKIVLVANPDYRALRFPRIDTGPYAAMSKAMQGKSLPRIGTIDISVIEEDSVRVLEFERGNLDYITLHSSAANRLLVGDRLRPDLSSRGVVRHATPEPYVFFVYFNVTDPTVGGMDKEAIGLRRAMMLAFDAKTMIDVLAGGQGLPANQMVPPRVAGHDPAFGDHSLYDPVAANALLDRLGFRRGADGTRTRPDGKPLVVTMTLRSGAISTELATLMRRNFGAVGIRVDFHMTPFQDAIKELERGKFSAYYGGYGGLPYGYGILQQLDSRASPVQNVSHFKLPEYDRAMDAFFHAPDAATQMDAQRTMAAIARTYVPMFPVMYRLQNDFVQPWLEGFAPQTFETYWKYMDIDEAKRRAPR